MDDDSIKISLSAEGLKQFAQLFQTIQGAPPDAQESRQPLGQFWTVDDRCRQRWPLATPEQRRRIRDVCVARYREHLGRYPFKLSGHANAAFMVEEEYLTILDGAIDTVRNDAEGRSAMPLFNRRPR
ncbi:MAG TPA: hypothetical protein VFW33_06260 [Gemmataceae bacterium]|nr:hypothetical protein [Gemmataceae bacterium]